MRSVPTAYICPDAPTPNAIITTVSRQSRQSTIAMTTSVTTGTAMFAMPSGTMWAKSSSMDSTSSEKSFFMAPVPMSRTLPMGCASSFSCSEQRMFSSVWYAARCDNCNPYKYSTAFSTKHANMATSGNAASCRAMGAPAIAASMNPYATRYGTIENAAPSVIKIAAAMVLRFSLPAYERILPTAPVLLRRRLVFSFAPDVK